MTCHGTIKALLFFVNFIFTLIGLGIFICGLLVIFAVDSFVKRGIESSQLPFAGYLGFALLVIGTVVFFLSFCGCFGAIKEINCLLGLYIILMTLMAIVQIVVAVYAITEFDEKTITKTLETHLKINMEGMKETDDGILHTMEFQFQCCGTTGPDSYKTANLTLPKSCCPKPAEACLIDSGAAYHLGCKEVGQSTVTKLNSIRYTLSYAFLGIAVFELLSMMASIYIIYTRKKHGQYYDYD